MKILLFLILCVSRMAFAAGWSISPASVTMSAVGTPSFPFGLSHTVSAGNDRYLILAIGARTFPATVNVSSASFGSQSAVLLTRTPSNFLMFTEFWGIPDPNVGSYFVGVTLDGTYPAIQGNQLCVAAYTLYGAYNIQTGARALGNGISFAHISPQASTSIVLDNWVFQNENNSLTPSTGVLIYSVPGYDDTNGNNSARGSYKVLADDTPFDMNWTGSNLNGKYQIALEILAASAFKKKSLNLVNELKLILP